MGFKLCQIDYHVSFKCLFGDLYNAKGLSDINFSGFSERPEHDIQT